MDYFVYEARIKNYKLLCSIQPHYKKSKYPYTHWTPEKIIQTGNMIKLIKSDKTAKKLVTHKKPKKGGAENRIWVFV